MDVFLGEWGNLLLRWAHVIAAIMWIGDSFLFRAYQEMGARITMVIMSLSPAFAAILGYFFLGETLSLQAMAGVLVTIGGICIVVLRRQGSEGEAIQATILGTVCALAGATGQAVNLLFAKEAFNEGPIDGFLATLIRIAASLAISARCGSRRGSTARSGRRTPSRA